MAASGNATACCIPEAHHTMWNTALTSWWPRRLRRVSDIPDALWARATGQLPFVQTLPAPALPRLRLLSAHFLAEKEFHGAHGLQITDAMALTVAIQACLPLLGLQPLQRSPLPALDWYSDFVTLVMHPDAALARRRHADAAGVQHEYDEALAGEAMAGGPVMLSWRDVQEAAHGMAQGHNLVIHEFAHKLDMRHLAPGDEPQGHPPLPARFMGMGPAAAHAHWARTMTDAYRDFCEAVSAHERFGEPPPWLDSYAASAPAEFFAVSCEAYMVQRQRFGQEFPKLLTLYDGFFDRFGWLNAARAAA